MKNSNIIFLTALACCIVLNGCSKKENSYENFISTMQETENSISEVNTETAKEAVVELPDDFVLSTSKQIKSLPDEEILLNEVGIALGSIGVQEIVYTAYGNYKEIGTVLMIDIYVVTDLHELVVHNQRINESWEVIWINNAKNGNMYYPLTGKDAYDYLTGECINQEKTETETQPETSEGNGSVITRKISELEMSGEKITDITTRDMKQYDYVKDVYISVDEGKNEVNIAVQVSLATDKDTAKMAGEDIARYLASMAGSANSYFKLPGSDDLGGIYDKYDLLIYIDDGNGDLALYGAKVKTSDKITWR